MMETIKVKIKAIFNDDNDDDEKKVNEDESWTTDIKRMREFGDVQS